MKLGSLQFVLDLYAVLMILQVESIEVIRLHPLFAAQGRAAILGGKKYGWHYYTADARARDELAVSVTMSAGRKQLTKGSTVSFYHFPADMY